MTGLRIFRYSIFILEYLNLFIFLNRDKHYNVVVISLTKLREFYAIHADAKDALNNWYRLVLQSDWSNYHEMKDMFNSVDSVGNDRYVFNIRGNNYRIVALIFFDIRTIYIRFVGTHAAYNKIDCAAI